MAEKTYGLEFEWDQRKAARNLRNHGVGFEEASTVFGDPLSSTVADTAHSSNEDRFVIIGLSDGQRLLVVIHTVRGARIRIISARSATNEERYQYEEIDG